MKKIIIFIVIIIIALIISAISLFNIIQKSEDNTININPIDPPSSANESKDPEYVDNLRISPRNMKEVMKLYQGPVTRGMFERDLYKFIVNHIPHLYEEIRNFNEEQIGTYYDNHTQEINDIHMYSREEFILICKDIQINITEKNKKDMPSPIIELTTCEDNVENFTFELILKYSDTNVIRLKTTFSKNEEKIEFQKYDELKDIFLKYNGPVTKQEVIHQVSSVVINARKIYESCRNLSLNKILQNYDLNKEELIKIGIISKENYLKITNQLVQVTWTKNPEYVGFTADVNTLEVNETYTSFITTINYETDEAIKVKIHVINAENLVNEFNPKIMITAGVVEK